MAFQITSSTTLEKVKFTVRQFMDRAYYNTFDEFLILMLGKKQSSYSQASVNELLTDQFAFNCKKHIIARSLAPAAMAFAIPRGNHQFSPV